jgi:hypothetical protein
MNNYFLIKNNRALIRNEALYFFGIDMDLLREKLRFQSEYS